MNPRENEISVEIEKFQGSWRQIEWEVGGVDTPSGELDVGARTIFSGTTFVVIRSDGIVVIEGIFNLDPTQDPKAVDWMTLLVQMQARRRRAKTHAPDGKRGKRWA